MPIFPPMYDICCIGHITSDKVVTSRSVVYMPGGTAYYFSCAISRLDVNYLLLTALGEKELHYAEALRNKGIGIQVQPSTQTVFFENIYGDDPDQRTQNVLEVADPFQKEYLQNIDARMFHLGPLLADDLPAEVVKNLAGKGVLSLDVQGYLRKVVHQKVYAAEWADKAQVLPYINILKADVAELNALTGIDDVYKGVKALANYGIGEIIITNASKGSMIWHEDNFYNIPAYMPDVVVDTTGCGDTYMAGYLYKRAKGVGVEEAGHFAAAMSGLKTAVPGAFEGSEDEVQEFRARTGI
ncbi:MAG: PfkB family carbohydrate kinase [Mucilaginibacter sp.]